MTLVECLLDLEKFLKHGFKSNQVIDGYYEITDSVKYLTMLQYLEYLEGEYLVNIEWELISNKLSFIITKEA